MDENLRLIQKISCRLPYESVREEQIVTLERSQCSYGFNGILNEGLTLPTIIDYFVCRGLAHRKEIREYYENGDQL